MEPLNTLSIGVQAQAGSKSHQQRNSLSAGTLKKMPSLAELRLRLKDKLPAGALDEPASNHVSAISPTDTIHRLSVSPRMTQAGTMGPPARQADGPMLPPPPGLMLRAASTNSLPTLAVIERRFANKHTDSSASSPTPSLSVNTAPQSTDMTRSKSAPEGPAPISATSCHPLQRPWTLFGDTKHAVASSPVVAKANAANYTSTISRVGTVTSIEAFARLMNWCKRPSLLLNGANVSFFHDDIDPTWEDPANAKGGKWTILLKAKNAARVDEFWCNLLLALVGEQIEPEEFVTGAMCSVRDRGNRIQIWVKDRNNVDHINQVGKAIADCLGIAEGMNVSMDFSFHQGSANYLAPKLFKINPSINPITQPLLTRSASMPHNLAIQIPPSPQKSPLGFSGFLASPTRRERPPPSPRSSKIRTITDENRVA